MSTTRERHDNIYRSVITTVVYHEGPHYAPDDLAQVHYDTYEGDCIGSLSLDVETTKVAPEAVVDELVAIGNDGSFFDGFDDEDFG